MNEVAEKLEDLKAPLTEDQKKAFDEICESISLGRWHVLIGYAGSGKTFLCQQLSKQYPRAVFTAPTNKAVGVLQTKIESTCITIHKFLGLKLKKGKLELSTQPNFGNASVLFIDESSMLNLDLMVILKSCCPENFPIVFVGDAAQLPPVNETLSQAFEVENKSVLNQIVRQAEGSPIIPYSKVLRTEGFDPKTIPSDDKVIFTRPSSHKYALIEKFIETGGIYTAWTNRTVDRMNWYMHTKLYPDCQTDFAVGETIVMGAPAINDLTGEIMANNGDEFVVKEIRPSRFKEYACWDITVDGCRYPLTVLRREERDRFNTESQTLAKEKRWGEFFQLKEWFHDVRHTYAYTCHKLQGTTVKKIMIDVPDIMLSKDADFRNKCMYVAVTRAAEKVLFMV